AVLEQCPTTTDSLCSAPPTSSSAWKRRHPSSPRGLERRGWASGRISWAPAPTMRAMRSIGGSSSRSASAHSPLGPLGLSDGIQSSHRHTLEECDEYSDDNDPDAAGHLAADLAAEVRSRRSQNREV